MGLIGYHGTALYKRIVSWIERVFVKHMKAYSLNHAAYERSLPHNPKYCIQGLRPPWVCHSPELISWELFLKRGTFQFDVGVSIYTTVLLFRLKGKYPNDDLRLLT